MTGGSVVSGSVGVTGGYAAGCAVSSGMLDSVPSTGAVTWGCADSAVTSGTVGSEIGSCTIVGTVASGCFLLWAEHDAVDKLTASTSSTANSWFLWFVFIVFLPFCSFFHCQHTTQIRKQLYRIDNKNPPRFLGHHTQFMEILSPPASGSWETAPASERCRGGKHPATPDRIHCRLLPGAGTHHRSPPDRMPEIHSPVSVVSP